MNRKLLIIFILIIIIFFPLIVTADMRPMGNISICFQISNISNFSNYSFVAFSTPRVGVNIGYYKNGNFEKNANVYLLKQIISDNSCIRYALFIDTKLYAIESNKFSENEINSKLDIKVNELVQPYKPVNINRSLDSVSATNEYSQALTDYFIKDIGAIPSPVKIIYPNFLPTEIPYDYPLTKIVDELIINSLNNNSLDIVKSKVLYSYTDGTTEELNYVDQNTRPEPTRINEKNTNIYQETKNLAPKTRNIFQVIWCFIKSLFGKKC